MKIKNAGRWAPRGVKPWAYTMLAVALASMVRISLHPFLGPVMPGAAFLIAAVLVEYWFGMTRAIFAITLGLCIADYLFVPPYQRITVFDRADLIFIISYPIIALITIGLLERLRRAQFRSVFIAKVAKSRYEMLLRLDNERALASRTADETHHLLRYLSHYHDDIITIAVFERKTSRPHVTPEHDVTSDIVHGARFDSVHPEDAVRLSTVIHPGSQRVRLRSGPSYKPFTCIAERFSTHAGEFLVFRVEVLS